MSGALSKHAAHPWSDLAGESFPLSSIGRPMKSVAALQASVALACGASATAAPVRHVDKVDSALPTQLPRTAIPHHYAITVTPNAELQAHPA